MADIKLINEGQYEFIDISNEEWREYLWPDYTIHVDGVQWLAVSGSGHRLLDIDGISHYIPFGWKHLRWKVKNGRPHFVR